MSYYEPTDTAFVLGLQKLSSSWAINQTRQRMKINYFLAVIILFTMGTHMPIHIHNMEIIIGKTESYIFIENKLRLITLNQIK